ncbi:hypothetical protein NQZ68_002360 [Dissostichus eleginoides]|nr:hypothetical protein NQZ68_002360 [Dissostichus eleginoides]
MDRSQASPHDWVKDNSALKHKPGVSRVEEEHGCIISDSGMRRGHAWKAATTPGHNGE